MRIDELIDVDEPAFPLVREWAAAIPIVLVALCFLVLSWILNRRTAGPSA